MCEALQLFSNKFYVAQLPGRFLSLEFGQTLFKATRRFSSFYWEWMNTKSRENKMYLFLHCIHILRLFLLQLCGSINSQSRAMVLIWSSNSNFVFNSYCQLFRCIDRRITHLMFNIFYFWQSSPQNLISMWILPTKASIGFYYYSIYFVIVIKVDIVC